MNGAEVGRHTGGVTADLLTRLRDRGWRLSPQRRVIAEVLTGRHVHLTAEEIHDRAGSRLPEISRATVYNTLNELVGMGEVLEVSVIDGPRRYDPNAHDPHQHLVCTGCHVILDVPAAAPPSGPTGPEAAGYLITGVDIVYRGLCPECAATLNPGH